MAINTKTIKYYSLLFVFIGGPLLYLIIFMDIFQLHSKSKYDVVDKANPKMMILVNRQLDLMISEYGSGKYAYSTGAPAQLRQFYQDLRTIETYTEHGTNSPMGYNGIRADLTYQDGRQVKGRYITSGGKSRLTSPRLLMRIELQNGRAKEVFTNGVEMQYAPDDAIVVINDLLNAVISLDKEEHHDNYFPPSAPQPDPGKAWERVR